MPVSGTISADFILMRANNIMNRTVPPIANNVATSILIITEADGLKTITNNKPRLADCVVPAIEGSTKRFCVSICIISPETLMALPARTNASVRGTTDEEDVAHIGIRPEISERNMPGPDE